MGRVGGFGVTRLGVDGVYHGLVIDHGLVAQRGGDCGRGGAEKDGDLHVSLTCHSV